MAKPHPDLSRIFQALADPTRRGIMERLSVGPAVVTELARPSGLRLPTVMRHLAVLEAAGLIESSKSGRSRICRSVPDALSQAEVWLSEVRGEWQDRTDRLEAYVTLIGDG